MLVNMTHNNINTEISLNETSEIVGLKAAFAVFPSNKFLRVRGLFCAFGLIVHIRATWQQYAYIHYSSVVFQQTPEHFILKKSLTYRNSLL